VLPWLALKSDSHMLYEIHRKEAGFHSMGPFSDIATARM
jgi:hypothetical protein